MGYNTVIQIHLSNKIQYSLYMTRFVVKGNSVSELGQVVNLSHNTNTNYTVSGKKVNH